MKKVIILFVVMAFMASVSSVAFGRTIDEEKQAVRDYLKVIDAKIIKARKAKQSAKVTMLKGEKSATLARWNKLKASLEVAPPPPPQAVAPVPPAPVVVKPAASAGLFGMGLNTSLSGLYISTGKGSLSGSIGAMGNLVLDDFIGLGPMVGLSANAVKFKVGTGYVMGGGGLKAVPVYGGGVINLPQWMGGQESYLTGGLNYVVYGNGKTSGKIGGDVYFGITADLGLGLGKTGFEIGYSVVRSNTVTSKGISLSVCQPIAL
ncbi:MAG: hypothetical protein WC903_07060 [Candidatus Margulisiibacteriota bacterium]